MKISTYFLVFTVDLCLSGGLGFLAAQFSRPTPGSIPVWTVLRYKIFHVRPLYNQINTARSRRRPWAPNCSYWLPMGRCTYANRNQDHCLRVQPGGACTEICFCGFGFELRPTTTTPLGILCTAMADFYDRRRPDASSIYKTMHGSQFTRMHVSYMQDD
jgi:hypothetical protein